MCYVGSHNTCACKIYKNKNDYFKNWNYFSQYISTLLSVEMITCISEGMCSFNYSTLSFQNKNAYNGVRVDFTLKKGQIYSLPLACLEV